MPTAGLPDEYKICITDYSSFVFDFVYLNRAIIYFMPDFKEFKAGMNDYRELDIPFKKGFGEFTQNEAELCTALQRIMENSGEPISPYKRKKTQTSSSIKRKKTPATGYINLLRNDMLC